MERNHSISLDDHELEVMFADRCWREKYPPILNVEAAAELAHVPRGTIYDWSSRGELDGCANKKGKRLRILRDRFVRYLFDVDNGSVVRPHERN